MSKKITTRSENFPDWYLEIVEAADLAEHSSVRGCMVIKPYGYAIWEKLQSTLDSMIKETGHQNAYFPLLIPKSFLTREAEHIDGFAKECAVVTHHRLRQNDSGEIEVDPNSKLTDELIIRPTSETIIYDTFSRWVKSWRDLPLLINQWANVFRWEMRTRTFIRTAEFLWQEGHTAHETYEESELEAIKMLNVYANLIENYLGIPYFKGKKSTFEKFAGALHTYSIETIMQDGKALQAATSHNLGQNFAKPFNIQFTSKTRQLEYVWQTSWGISTRILGALIMVHSDDNGLVLPPKIAPIQVVLLPILKPNTDQTQILNAINQIKTDLEIQNISVKVDTRDHLSFGEKSFEYEKKGVPLRIELGLRDLESNTATVCRRDLLTKQPIAISDLKIQIPKLLEQIQNDLLSKAKEFQSKNIFTFNNFSDFKNHFDSGKTGFAKVFWCEQKICHDQIADQTKTSSRCYSEDPETPNQCFNCNTPATKQIYFAKAY